MLYKLTSMQGIRKCTILLIPKKAVSQVRKKPQKNQVQHVETLHFLKWSSHSKWGRDQKIQVRHDGRKSPPSQTTGHCKLDYTMNVMFKKPHTNQVHVNLSGISARFL